MNITENITAVKHVTTKEGRELVLVTTASDKKVWVNKKQYDDKAELITYVVHAKGSKWTSKDGKTSGVRNEEVCELMGFGKQSKLDSSKKLLEHVIALGITPTFSLS